MKETINIMKGQPTEKEKIFVIFSDTLYVWLLGDGEKQSTFYLSFSLQTTVVFDSSLLIILTNY